MDYLTPLSLLLFTIFLFFILGLCKWDTSRSPSRSGRLPPSPTAFPILGHLHLLTDKPHHTFTRLAHQLGPLIYLRLGRVPTVVVSSAHLARLVLKTHDHIFASRPQLVGPRYLSFGCSDVTYSTYGPYWRQVRKICVSELLTSKRVNSFQLVRDEEVDRMLSSVLTQSGSEVDLRKLFSTLTNDILCRVAFGRRFTTEEGPIGKLVRAFEGSEALFAGFCVGDYFPEWKWVNSVSGLNRKLEKGMKELREACNEIIDEHMNNNNNNNGSDSTRREDFVDVLLRVHRRQDLEVPITDDNLKALMLVLTPLFDFFLCFLFVFQSHSLFAMNE
ncbi:hypothetical protein FEM48_Zijuj10G0043500 [Ziziphus jujuba var. spinosa]|uniref:Cytochrome P450 71A1-like n=1 Tax=Ziziphus jujuba var. spinosa TaxID=714518 RepID=A0A978UL96_ZIZJJ|nr:hypothetical protein FEM48_Zijuj10G0043500 [Ziziphus jujuba var. spinosa]